MDTSTHTPPSPPSGSAAPAAESRRRGHEVTDASIRAIVTFMIALTIGTGIIALGVYFLRNKMESHLAAVDHRESPWGDAHDPPPEPRLEPSVDHPTLPADDLLALQNRWRRELGAYASVAGSENVVSIPIDRAMRLMAQRGLQPATRPATGPATAPASGGAK